ncbi:hypothetical protein [Streptomyces sp. NRRL F-5123]|uniref:hypothetical protein n=1 Tax=Streptomyces sp. NRRL F-5123 TaxID=1463856 RepID=UPI0004E1074A|nr:hypothetical protein [Streptomyces sp. NRRL F-5123]
MLDLIGDFLAAEAGGRLGRRAVLRAARRRKRRFEQGEPFAVGCRIRDAGAGRAGWRPAQLREQNGRLVFAPDWHFADLTAPLGEVRIESERPPTGADAPVASARYSVIVGLTTPGRTVEVLLNDSDADCLRVLLARAVPEAAA